MEGGRGEGGREEGVGESVLEDNLGGWGNADIKETLCLSGENSWYHVFSKHEEDMCII